jgi:hypothetical protein
MREVFEREPESAEQVHQRPRLVPARVSDDAIELMPPMQMQWRAQGEPSIRALTRASSRAPNVVADVFQMRFSDQC